MTEEIEILKKILEEIKNSNLYLRDIIEELNPRD